MSATWEYRSLADARAALAGRLDRARTPGLFSRIDWFDSLHRHIFSADPVHIVRSVENTFECWLFLRGRGGRRLSALANWYSFDWGPIFLGDPDAATRDRLLEAVARRALENQAQVDFYPVADPAPLLHAFCRAGWFAVRRAMGGRHLLALDGRDFATWWAARPGHLRSLAKRKGRNSPFTLTIAHQVDEALWADYVDVHARSWKEPEPALPFLRALAEREAAAGTLRLGFARLDGRAVAAQLWTVENGVANIHKLSHDQAHDRASPGTLLGRAMFAHAIDVDGVALIDYGTGDNAYKTDWMEQRQTLYRIDCFNPRFARTWIPAARTAISALVG